MRTQNLSQGGVSTSKFLASLKNRNISSRFRGNTNCVRKENFCIVLHQRAPKFLVKGFEFLLKDRTFFALLTTSLKSSSIPCDIDARRYDANRSRASNLSIAHDCSIKAQNDSRVILSSSRNAVSISSALTMNRFPSSRCASAIQIVRPWESMAETQPQLQPALLRLSAMISQYFMLCRTWLVSLEQPD